MPRKRKVTKVRARKDVPKMKKSVRKVRGRRDSKRALRNLERLSANLAAFEEVAQSTRSMLDDLQELISDTESQNLLRMFRALPIRDKKTVAHITWRLYQRRKLH